jgi:type II secretory pathway pseudopilin PulG
MFSSHFKLPDIGRRGLSAFTLVEVIITMIVLSFGCLAVLNMQTSSLRGTTRSEHITVATYLAEAETERLKSVTFEDLTEAIENGRTRTKKIDRSMNVCPGNNTNGCKDYPYSMVTRYYPHFPTSFSHYIEVDVSWNDQSGNHTIGSSASVTDLSF